MDTESQAPSQPTRVAVCGTGSWGTAFSAVLADAGAHVRMWGKFADEVADIQTNHSSTRYLPDLALPDTITATTDPQEALDGAQIVVMAIPAQTLRDNLAEWGRFISPDAVVVSLIKGIELGTTKRMSEVLIEAGGVGQDRIAVVSGPNLAKEIARKEPAATVIASTSPATADRVAQACATRYFRPYTNTDVIGCELAGTVKNVIALAVGMAEGLGLGDNSKAALMTRGLAEIQRLGVAMGADSLTFSGLAGVGDLIVTCMSPLSRNSTFGRKLGGGMSVEEVVADTHQTAEGVKSCRAVLDLARHYGVDMPIVENVVAVVHEGRSPREVGSLLMSRARKAERR
ncbi:MAG TPA: NAD(P)H-dependent glycerol-3-phosphate dehydrogenase [Dermatophilaceae bacterium]|nr:NAD(P)H-dependent glycerol-3-phosphate dehydrogenase [Dermatophilaceae bacterium]